MAMGIRRRKKKQGWGGGGGGGGVCNVILNSTCEM